MKRTPLERRTELKRTNGLKRTASAPKRRAISPASPAQREKVKAHGSCIVCAREPEWDGVPLDPAHLWPRGRGGCDSAFCVVPLCRFCHNQFDDGILDLLSVLNSDWEQWRHHVQHALCHARPVELLERLAGARTQWSDV